MNNCRNLHDLDSRRAGQYKLRAILRPVAGRVGWTHFSIYLEDEKGGVTCSVGPDGVLESTPVIEGIHSPGGKGIKAWIEVESYSTMVHFCDGMTGPRLLELTGSETERDLMRFLAGKVAPGGHMMFPYDSSNGTFYRQTRESLLGNIPPVCTPLGMLLYEAGFRLVKDWYLAEGGFEGPRKLWGEKPEDDGISRQFDVRTFFQVLAYCPAMPHDDIIDLELAARKRAGQVLSGLQLAPPLSDLAERVAVICRDCVDREAMETAARRTCCLISSLISAGVVSNIEFGELKNIAGTCAAEFQQ